jgi:hypothetical protein
MINTIDSSLHIVGFVNCNSLGGGSFLLALTPGTFNDIYEFRN